MAEPEIKAEELKRHCYIHTGEITERGQVLFARAYINQLLNDIPNILAGDYKMAYKHEYWQYQSYWYEILKYLKTNR